VTRLPLVQRASMHPSALHRRLGGGHTLQPSRGRILPSARCDFTEAGERRTTKGLRERTGMSISTHRSVVHRPAECSTIRDAWLIFLPNYHHAWREPVEGFLLSKTIRAACADSNIANAACKASFIQAALDWEANSFGLTSMSAYWTEAATRRGDWWPAMDARERRIMLMVRRIVLAQIWEQAQHRQPIRTGSQSRALRAKWLPLWQLRPRGVWMGEERHSPQTQQFAAKYFGTYSLVQWLAVALGCTCKRLPWRGVFPNVWYTLCCRHW